MGGFYYMIFGFAAKHLGKTANHKKTIMQLTVEE